MPGRLACCICHLHDMGLAHPILPDQYIQSFAKRNGHLLEYSEIFCFHFCQWHDDHLLISFLPADLFFMLTITIISWPSTQTKPRVFFPTGHWLFFTPTPTKVAQGGAFGQPVKNDDTGPARSSFTDPRTDDKIDLKPRSKGYTGIRYAHMWERDFGSRKKR